MHRITRDIVSYFYEVTDSPRLAVSPGATVVFETWDARAGALLDRPPGIPFELPLPTPGRGNPLTGPLAVQGAEPGDALVVRIDRIECRSPGWCGGHAHVGPFPKGRVPRPVGRVCRIEGSSVRYSDDVLLPLEPMVGCIGTAVPGDAPQAGTPGRHGGNLDHPVVAEGTTVFLPVLAKRGLLYVGDVHATQGDGELSGVAVEIPAEVTVTIDLQKEARLRWPWAVTDGAVMVMTADLEFGRAREEAVEALMRVLESQLGLEPADAMALISVAGNLRIGQAFGGMELTLRLEMPRTLGIVPA